MEYKFVNCIIRNICKILLRRKNSSARFTGLHSKILNWWKRLSVLHSVISRFIELVEAATGSSFGDFSFYRTGGSGYRSVGRPFLVLGQRWVRLGVPHTAMGRVTYAVEA